MDISTSCHKCIHRPICLVIRKIRPLIQEFNHLGIFECNRDFEDVNSGIESIIAANCKYYKEKRSDWA